MTRSRLLLVSIALSALAIAPSALAAAPAARGQATYQDLVRLFEDFVAFERPALKDGAPDYTASTLARKHEALGRFNARLARIDPKNWPVAEQVDHALVGALIDGLDFELRVLRPWERDPAYYKSLWMGQSDTPAHEGPTHHAVVELWQYAFPLSAGDQGRLAGELRGIAPLLAQARGNLTGNARDLWITGTGTMAEQVRDLDALEARVAGASSELLDAIRAARAATAGFVAWLEQQAPSKTGPSGIGKEAYTWNLQNVHLVPMTWEDEVALLKRELARAHAALKLEEHRNRDLPPLTAASDADDYRRRAEASAAKYMAWLESDEVLTVEPYLAPGLNAHLGGFVPLDRRNFFGIASHYEPMTLFAHFYHWFDHEWMRHAPHASPIRRGATLFNVWDSRSEGMATAMEEIILHAGYYDDNPRAREIVWIMLAQRAARGLASLYAQANEFDLQQAKAFQVEWTPRGWMRPDLDLLGFEQQLYLRQPGYGTSYVTGKALIDELIAARARQLGDDFTLRRFFDELNGAGMIPVSLIHRQLTAERPAAFQPVTQLTFDVPAGWHTKPSSSSMRVAEFVLPGDAGGPADAALTVYFFGRGSGGGVQANVDRWIGQMTQPDGRPSRDVARTDSRASRAGLPLTIVDVTGTYVAEVTPGSSQRFNEPGYRLIAAVVDTPGGAHYVKLTGPADTVARWERSVTAFLDSLRME